MIKNSWKKGMNSYSVSVELLEKKDEQFIPVKILFLKNRNKKSDWIALICTDEKLADDEIIRIYGKRWDIEVFLAEDHINKILDNMLESLPNYLRGFIWQN